MRTITARMLSSIIACRRLRNPTKRRQVLQQIVEIAIAHAIGTVHRHQRLLLDRERRQVRLEIALQPLARVHDLNRELVLVLLHAADALAVARDERDRLVSWSDQLAGSANLAHQPRARPRRSDPRQIWTEL